MEAVFGAPEPAEKKLAVLRARLEKAKQDYDRARIECQHLLSISHDLAAPNCDGLLALQQAMELKRTAACNYNEALRDFTRFLFDQFPSLPHVNSLRRE